jgi:hypothetical protein
MLILMGASKNSYTDAERIELQVWALENLHQSHAGQLIVLFGNTIVASGFDEEAVLWQAKEWAARERVPPSELITMVIPEEFAELTPPEAYFEF